MKPKEFWLCGEANEHDVGIWYDHHPGYDAVYGKEFHRHHVIEYSAYEKVVAERNRYRGACLRFGKQMITEVEKCHYCGGEFGSPYMGCSNPKFHIGSPDETISKKDATK